ncbi:uncharacterized protein MELLADRAFT_103708 [Melampsora larici-populina 98AG31]|uniref:Secreted protein n=1 Tax=Melampsora larici-populina (strain 98AG31 / pathotype 3-4-7) TaxID=747676 RepID=F4RCP9_MELLP|nr:uncharacterized protein MELLADRAFT_103708 [Melampsora larici-populina 98AG31]EGG09669.1 hypothetical protein MELLADRAFT_103708 [Melampsora larici-populina 98AG31]
MTSNFKFLGALHLLCLSLLSFQMDQTSIHEFHQIQSAEVPDLELSLSLLPAKQESTRDSHFQTIHDSEGISDQDLWMLKQVKEEDMHDPFDMPNQPSNYFDHGSISRPCTGSSKTSWLTLIPGNSDKRSVHLSRTDLIKINSHGLGTSQQVKSPKPWLTLGNESTLSEKNAGIDIPDTDVHNTIYATGVTCNNNIQTSPPRESTETIIDHPLDNISLEVPQSGSSTSMKRHIFQEFGNPSHNVIDSHQEYSIRDQQEPHPVQKDESLRNSKRLRVIATQKQKEPHTYVQGLQDDQDVEGFDDERLGIFKSHKKTKFCSSQKGIGESSQSPIIPSDFILVDTIKEISTTHNLLPQKIQNDISIWTFKLEKNVLLIMKQNQNVFGEETYPFLEAAVSRAGVVANCFLTCIKLLHEDQQHDVQGFKDYILEDGWRFIQRLFNQWVLMDWSNLRATKRREHIDDLQPHVLYNYLGTLKANRFTIGYMWVFWKRWYRESTYPQKRLLATKNCFVKHIQYSILHHGFIDFPIDPEAILQSFKPIDRIEVHKHMLKEHSLQFNRLKDSYPKSVIDYVHLVYMVHHVGTLELELLEHHEPVVEWLEGLLQHLQEEITKQGLNNEERVKSISQCVRATYSRLIPAFFGAIKLMDQSESLVSVKEKDVTISNAWTFLKAHLDQWRKSNMCNIFNCGNMENIPGYHCSGDSHTLFKAMLKLKSNFRIPFVCSGWCSFTTKNVWWEEWLNMWPTPHTAGTFFTLGSKCLAVGSLSMLWLH